MTEPDPFWAEVRQGLPDVDILLLPPQPPDRGRDRSGAAVGTPPDRLHAVAYGVFEAADAGHADGDKPSPEAARLFVTLSRFAGFAGLGRGTTHGR